MKTLIRTLLLMVTMACGFTGATALASAASSVPTGTYRYDLAFEVLDYLNEERSKEGLSKLKMDAELTNEAMTRAGELSIKYSHTRPNGQYFNTIGRAVTENIAYGYKSAKSANTAWTNSKDHYRNMTGNYTGVGIGCFQGADGTLYWTEEFGKFESKAKQKSNYSVGTAKGTSTSIKSIQNATNGIKLTWGEVYGVSGYQIYRKESRGSYKLIKTISSSSKTSYTDKSIKDKGGTKYKYKVLPYSKSDGKTGKCSNPKAMVRLARPEIASIKADKYGNVTVKWGKVKGASGYRIYYSTDKSYSSDVHWKTEKSGLTKSHTFTSLTPGTKYYIKVEAYSTKSGTKYYSKASAVKGFTVTGEKLSAPSNVKASSDTSGKAVLNWTKVSGATGYKLYFSTDSTFSGTKYYYTVNGGNTTSYTVPNLKSGKKYYFYLVSCDDSGKTSTQSDKSEVVSCKVK